MLSGVSGLSSSFSMNRLIAVASGQRAGSASRIGSAPLGAPDDEAAPVQETQGVFGGKSELTEEERAEIEELRKRDQEVRQHEQLHKATAGQYARGAPSYEYKTGPDGKRYAVSGKVNIDTSPVPNDPEATINKMRQIQQAANAVADPSTADQQVAAQAAATEREARSELAARQAERGSNPSPEAPPDTDTEGDSDSDDGPASANVSQNATSTAPASVASGMPPTVETAMAATGTPHFESSHMGLLSALQAALSSNRPSSVGRFINVVV